MATARYEFDELNRLVIHDPLDAAQPRRVVEGRVMVDRRNRLQYRARTKAGTSGRAGESDVTLDGTWLLSPQHELGLLLHPSREHDGQQVFLRGSLADVKANALVVSLAHRSRDGRRTSQRLSLSGRWQADERNRLAFLVAKADGTDDRLVFDGAWTVDRTHRLRYRYEEPQAGRRRRAVRMLEFDGAWDLRPGARLAYRLGATDRSTFEFQAALQSPTLNARDGRVVYQLGIRLSDGRTVRRTATLFGVWKLHRDFALSFEMAYPEGRRRRLMFEGQVGVLSRTRLSVQAVSRQGEPLGFAVTFSRAFLQDARWFVRLQREGEDARLLGGVQVRF
ncbi:MAG: hypothetical protein HYY91_06945 [Candidatus Omnitrophica bacterium]|nr:hypothetical protein [Candidatus Omnitrophota bacterium]